MGGIWSQLGGGGGSGGDVVGPGSSVTNDFAAFADTTGKLLKDSGFTDTDFLKVANDLSDVNDATTAFDNVAPTTTKGDLIAHNGTNNVRVPVGTNGQALVANSAVAAGVEFQTISAAFTPALFLKNYAWGFADFFSVNSSPDEFGRYSNGGSGGFVTGDPEQWGVYNINTSSSSTGRSLLYNGQSAIVTTGGEIQIEWAVNLVTALSDGSETYVAFVGLVDSAFTTVLSSMDDLIGFRYTHTENSGNWTGVCKRNGTETAVDLGTAAAADTWIRLKVIINADATSVSFYINDVEGSNSPITTNIPQGGVADSLILGAYIEKSVGTTARSMYCDYCEWLKSFTNPRND